MKVNVVVALWRNSYIARMAAVVRDEAVCFHRASVILMQGISDT
jgi:hypothetical protein